VVEVKLLLLFDMVEFRLLAELDLGIAMDELDELDLNSSFNVEFNEIALPEWDVKVLETVAVDEIVEINREEEDELGVI